MKVPMTLKFRLGRDATVEAEVSRYRAGFEFRAVTPRRGWLNKAVVHMSFGPVEAEFERTILHKGDEVVVTFELPEMYADLADHR